MINPFDFFVEEYAERSDFRYPPELADDLEPYLRPVGENPLMTSWLADHPELTAAGQPIVGFLVGLNRQIAGDVAYSVRMEPGVQTSDVTLGRVDRNLVPLGGLVRCAHAAVAGCDWLVAPCCSAHASR